jgi:hypothetical protein
MESAVIARPLWNSCNLKTIFSVYVSTLFRLKKADNFYEFKYLYPNQTFSKFLQQNWTFIFSPFLLDCCCLTMRFDCTDRRLHCRPQLVEKSSRPQLACNLPALTSTPAHFVDDSRLYQSSLNYFL